MVEGCARGRQLKAASESGALGRVACSFEVAGFGKGLALMRLSRPSQHLEGWDFGTAIYHCFVTASTVGYGDVPITSERGMQWATCHIFISV